MKSAKWKKFTFRNNIWYGNVGGLLSWSEPTPSPFDWDYDDLYSAAGRFIQIGQPGKRATIPTTTNPAEAYAGAGWLQHGISANPQFVNAAGGRLQPLRREPLPRRRRGASRHR